MAAVPPPEDPRPADGGFPRWPLWFPVAALFAGLAFGFVAIGVLAGVLDATGVDTRGNSPGLTAAGTVIVDLAVVAASLLVAAMVARPRPWQFGLRRAPLGSTAAAAGIGIVTFF